VGGGDPFYLRLLKEGSKRKTAFFGLYKIALRLRKVCYSCKAFIGLNIRAK